MENKEIDILNNKLTILFDKLIEENVVVEKSAIKGFRNVLNYNVTANQPPSFPPMRPNFPPMPPPPNMPPQFNYAVFLARNIYWQIVTLMDLYEQLILQNPANAPMFNSMKSQLELLRITMLNIYRRLSGNNFIFGRSEKIELSSNYCTALQETYDYLSNLNGNVFYLQRLVNINDIDRQLIIMLATLNTQLNNINNLIKNC